jgi:hypothetical protein
VASDAGKMLGGARRVIDVARVEEGTLDRRQCANGDELRERLEFDVHSRSDGQLACHTAPARAMRRMICCGSSLVTSINAEERSIDGDHRQCQGEEQCRRAHLRPL